MRIATYTRISTDEEHQPHSLGAQADRLAAYCASQEDWQIVYRFEDQITGTLYERPGLSQALAAARSGRFDLLLVYRVDRLARSVRTLAEILSELDRAGVGFRSATEPFDTTTAAGRMMVQMLGVFAEFERATIIDRVVAGMEKKARRGGWVPGIPPIGYQIGEDGFLEPSEPQGSLVRRIFSLYIEKRLGTRALANLLNDQGERTQAGKLWSNASVQGVLQNPVYIGRIRWRKETFEAPHEPLVDTETFEAAQALIGERSADRSKRRSNSSDYLLSGKVRCGHCGSAMVGSAAHGSGGRYRYYTCYKRHRYGKVRGCEAERIPADALEEQLLTLITRTLSDSGFLERAVERAAELADTERPRRLGELKALERTLKEREQVRERYLAAFERGTLSDRDCGARLRALGEEIAKLEARRSEFADQIAATPPAALDAGTLEELVSLLENGLPTNVPSERKHILGQLIESIEIRGRDWIKPTLRLPVVRIEDGEVGRAGIEPATLGLKVRSDERRRVAGNGKWL
jgi:site-specific DNA recombinase